ncbi:MAG: alkaline phosphatase family protein [Candidatus Tumulicola sp.]
MDGISANARALAVCLMVAIAGCNANGGVPGAGALPVPNAGRPAALLGSNRQPASGKISHVVIIMQENRSFDNLFAGYPGADTQSYGYTANGTKVTLQPVSMGAPWDVGHNSVSFYAACDGQGSLPGTACKMDGFNREVVTCGGRGQTPCPNPNPQYAFVPHSETKPYFAMAQQYVLGDNMFPSDFDASSFVSHQYIIAGQAGSTINYPATTWGCDGGPKDTVPTVTLQRGYGARIQACFNYQTLGDELDSAGISWGYYTSSLEDGSGNLWNAYQAIKRIRYGPDWDADDISPQTRFLSDVKNGKLRAVSWITPTCRNSDHASCGATHGPHWVASIVNAVGNSKYWDSTAIFVMWDEYGGWYDHVPPPLADYDGLGIRVPLLVISAYAKKGYVSHVQYEHGSILKFVEDQFGLSRLAASDARATSPAGDCFDFTQPPRAFVPIPAVLNAAYFERESADLRVPDNN